MSEEVNIEQESSKQASVTKSLRVTEDRGKAYEEVRKAIGGTANHFTDWLVEAYRLHQSRETSDLFKQDTKAIMDMFNSIFTTINGIVGRAEGIVQSKDAAIQEELRSKDDIAEELREEIQELQQVISNKDIDMKAQKDAINALKAELKEQEEILQKVQKDNETTAQLNNVLLAEKERYKAIEVANKELEERNAELQEKLAEAEKQAIVDAQKINELEREKEALIEKQNDKITSIETAHNQALEHLESMKELAVAQARTETKEQAQVKIEEYIAKEEELREKVSSMQETINQHTADNLEKDREIELLKQEIESLKTKKRTTKKEPKGETLEEKK